MSGLGLGLEICGLGFDIAGLIPVTACMCNVYLTEKLIISQN